MACYFLDELSSLQFIRALRLERAEPSLEVAAPCAPLDFKAAPSPAGCIDGADRPRSEEFRDLVSAAEDEVRGALETCLPASLLVAAPSDRCRPSGPIAATRVEGSLLPKGAFLQVATGVFICSAAHALVRLATRLDLGTWLLAAYELCGIYALDGAGGARRTRPVTADETLKDEVRSFEGVRGGRAARMRAPFVQGGSASPRESQTAALFSLPLRHGGYGLPTPELNAPVTLKPRDRRKPGATRTYVPDLLWREKRLVLEYDSDLEHTAQSAIAHDACRRNELESHGFTVLTMTNRQLKNIAACDDAARQLSCHLEIRQRRRDFSDTWRQRNRDLRKSLGLPC